LPSRPPSPIRRYVADLLRQLGHRANLRVVTPTEWNAAINDYRHPPQIDTNSWIADYPSPSQWITLQLGEPGREVGDVAVSPRPSGPKRPRDDMTAAHMNPQRRRPPPRPALRLPRVRGQRRPLASFARNPGESNANYCRLRRLAPADS